jgi:hypothetical protein
LQIIRSKAEIAAFLLILICCHPAGCVNVAETSLSNIENVRQAPVEQEVLQPGTGLFWMRCPVGQQWDGQKCIGEVAEIRFADRKSACPDGYRLPTIFELVELLGKCDEYLNPRMGAMGYCQKCIESQQCARLFGDDRHWYWSSSDHGNGTYAWGAGFGNGSVIIPFDVDTGFARCLRSVHNP